MTKNIFLVVWLLSGLKILSGMVSKLTLSKRNCSGGTKDLYSLLGGSSSRNIKNPCFVWWIKPKTGQVKINIDGGFKEWMIAGIGGIFRNSMGKCNLYCHSSCLVFNALHAKFMACLFALHLALLEPDKEYWLESDSTTLVNALTNLDWTPPWYLNNVYKIIRGCLLKLNIRCSHIFREANRLVDLLAGSGLLLQTPFLGRHPDYELNLLINGDNLTIPYVRTP